MTEPTTIRQDLEGIRDTARDGEDIENVAELHFLLACIREHAAAAIALLDKSETPPYAAYDEDEVDPMRFNTHQRMLDQKADDETPRYKGTPRNWFPEDLG